jgi:hypothetical protein
MHCRADQRAVYLGKPKTSAVLASSMGTTVTNAVTPHAYCVFLLSLLLLGQAGMTGRRRLRGLTIWQRSSTGVLQLT